MQKVPSFYLPLNRLILVKNHDHNAQAQILTVVPAPCVFHGKEPGPTLCLQETSLTLVLVGSCRYDAPIVFTKNACFGEKPLKTL